MRKHRFHNRKMEKKSIIITIILLLILGVLIFMLIREFGKGFDNTKNNIKPDNKIINNNENLNIAPSIPLNQASKINNPNGINPKVNYTKPLSENEITGKWIAIEENTRGEVNTNLENYSIEFKGNKKYISIVVGFIEEGTYKIDGNNITFYDKENNLPTPAFGSLEQDKLIITYPQYPKIVTYKREN